MNSILSWPVASHSINLPFSKKSLNFCAFHYGPSFNKSIINQSSFMKTAHRRIHELVVSSTTRWAPYRMVDFYGKNNGKSSPNWKSSPSRGENKKYLKPPARICIYIYIYVHTYQSHWDSGMGPRAPYTNPL